MNGDKATGVKPRRWLSAALWIGPILLYLAATAYGILEVHSSTDTWIGLAAGRQILTADEFPTQDTFSYTFYGETWYNQNWLTHLVQYWLYSRVAPNAVIYGTWTLSASVFALVLLAAYWRSKTWLGALVTASVVALGCRDFLSARPATTGFFCIASLWMLLCALEGQGDKRRWWPIFLLLPLLLIWGNAHGSFVFGYGVLGLYVGNWFVSRLIRVPGSWLFTLATPLAVLLIGGVFYSVVREDAPVRLDEMVTIGPTSYAKKKLMFAGALLVVYVVYWVLTRRLLRTPVSDRQALAIVGVVFIALALTVLFGPFGIENFTHGQKIAGSEVFRQVSEWRPPFAPGKHFPPVWRFKVVLGVSLGMLLASGVLCVAARTKRPLDDRRLLRKARDEKKFLSSLPRTDAEATDVRLHTSLFDLAVVVIGLAMTLWARRFAPIYFIFGAPVLLVWILLLVRPVDLWLRRYLRLGVMAGAGLLALATIAEAATKAHEEIVVKFADYPQFNVLERVTRYDLTPHDAMLFLRKNDLHVNLLLEWTQAGVAMFRAPNAKVFMDGRSQQVYDELHYRKYYALLVAPETPRPLMTRLLDEHNTDAVLLRRTGRAQNLWTGLLQSGQWMVALMGNRFGLFLRKDSRALAELGELLRRGEEWRPNTTWAIASRGFVWEAIHPPDLEQAIACWDGAVRRNVLAGDLCFRPTTRALLDLGRIREARQYVSGWHRRLNQPVPGLSDNGRRELLKALNVCWNDIETATQTDENDHGEKRKSDDSTDGEDHASKNGGNSNGED